MSILHIVNKSPYERNSFDSCLRLARKGSAVLLIEDGVYAAQSSGDVASRLNTALADFDIYALQPDVVARGINEKINNAVTLIDYDGFVNLTTEYDKVQSWL